MNREQRRKQQKKIKRPSYHGLTYEQKIERLFQNGITLEDLRKERKEHFEQGYALGRDNMLKMSYAAICMALKDIFQRDQIIEILRKVDDNIVCSLDSEEIIDQVLQETGIIIQFKEPINRIQEV